jgi:transposase
MLFNARRLLTKETTMLKNEIHGILLGQGIKVRSSEFDSGVGLKRISELCADSSVNFTLVALTEALKTLVSKIKEFDRKLEELGPMLPGFANLKSIYGLGTNTCALLIATIGNINDFPSPNKLASYLGVVPRVRNSNQSIKHGTVTKRGNALLRGNLTMCVLAMIGKNKRLALFYERIKLKGGHKKAIVATAHKLVKIIYYTLKHNWFFVDFCEEKRKFLAISW